ncbi:glycoside hydrolase/deacetylase [Microthyrium microscopicum]|uniref:Glycoside hydrolase/deacetylase n=1 Tax=Microthyrium microscopicum TaxID=703497 RepID=A0A6A6UHP7_9PEZI|nr:glycoside hydrolase/deacetylase [Microthyrium microscopicum]
MVGFKQLAGSVLLSSLVSATPLERRQNVPVGQIINSCTQPGVFAISFDDGPYIYTSGLLDTLDAAGIKATFFMNGQNYDNINNYATVVQRMSNEGHQVASHTWSHADLATLDAAGITSQMTQLEAAFTSIIGKIPTYMRPPYFSTNALVLSTLGGLGYKVIQADVDTLDWEYGPEGQIATSEQIFQSGLDSGATINLSHDPLPNTISDLVPYMINAIKAKGLRGVTVGECLGDAAGNWYKTTSGGGGTTPPPSGGATSPDGTCGGANAYVCPSGLCCSQYGYCDT